MSDPSEHFPPPIKLQLLQNAVRTTIDLRIVETLDEFQSITDTPSDEFYTINTNKSGLPMSARHKLQPRLPWPNQGPNTFPNTFPRNKINRNGLFLSTSQNIYQNF